MEYKPKAYISKFFRLVEFLDELHDKFHRNFPTQLAFDHQTANFFYYLLIIYFLNTQYSMIFFSVSRVQTHPTYLSSEIFSPYRDRGQSLIRTNSVTKLPLICKMELTPAEKLLKEVNLSLTRQRVAVLELFLKEEHPMTPHEVRKILEEQEHVDQVDYL